MKGAHYRDRGNREELTPLLAMDKSRQLVHVRPFVTPAFLRRIEEQKFHQPHCIVQR